MKMATLMCTGPYKFVGGMNKGRPNQEDIDGAVEFYDKFLADYGEILVEERLKRDKRDAFNAAHPAGGLFTNLKRSAKKIAKRVKGDNSKATDEKTTVPLATDADAFNAAHPAGGLFTNLKRSAKKIAKRVKGDNSKATDEKTTVPLATDAPSATGEPTTSENQ